MQMSCFNATEEIDLDGLNPAPDPLSVISEQLRTLIAEQASLRILLKNQHTDILKRLRASPLERSSTGLRKSPSSSNKDPLPVVQEDGSGLETQPQTANPLAPALSRSDHQVGALAKAAGKGVFIDIHKLPQTWATEAPKGDDPVACRQVSRGPIRFRDVQAFFRSGYVDGIVTGVVLLNFCTMWFQLSWRSYYTEFLMGRRANDNGWTDAKGVFEIIEVLYTTIFAIEVILRLSVLGSEYLHSKLNLFDVTVVGITCVQMYLLQPLGAMKNASFIAVARLIRLVRLARLIKVVRAAESCADLRILVRAFSSCVGSLFWSMLCVGSLVSAGSVMVFQIVSAYVEDESNPAELREWIYDRFGTLSLCMVALWECTLTGSWHRYSYVMIVEMNPMYALFWVPYVLCINFAMMRIIGALFLKETLAASAIDAEKMKVAKMNRKRKFADIIREIFVEVDKRGLGKITAEEFEQLLYNAHVGTCFSKLELEVAEVAVLFELLAADDGAADYHEFLEGALKLKQTAQTIDVIQLIHGNQKLGVALQTMWAGLCEIAHASGVNLDRDTVDMDLNHSDAHNLFVRSSNSDVAKQAQDDTEDSIMDCAGD